MVRLLELSEGTAVPITKARHAQFEHTFKKLLFHGQTAVEAPKAVTIWLVFWLNTIYSPGE